MMPYKMICFDVDGTLIDETIYIWVTLHDAFGIPLSVRKKHQEAYLSGIITYAEWFGLDLLEWQKSGKRKSDLVQVIGKLKPMNGALKTVTELRKRGYVVTVVSGSLDLVLNTVLPQMSFDEILINKILFDKKGRILGGIPTPYDVEKKALGLEKLARQYGFKSEECVFVGDNENDLHIAGKAGFSIAFNVKSQKLAEISDIVITEKDLRAILKYL